MQLFKIISASLSPNTEIDDVLLAIRTLLSPWRWKQGKELSYVTEWFLEYFPGHKVGLFNSGRSALLALLKAFEIGEGNEVLVQAFTCVAVPNSIIWAGARPIYVDIDQTLNINVKDTEKKITKKTKAIIVQHTFGIPSDIDSLVTLAKKHKLLLIEDCAHALGASYQEKKLGTFGDGAFFSFGRDKVISSVWGGAAIINAKFQIPNDKLKKFQESLLYPSQYWILQQLLHPIAFFLILPLYLTNIGKIILVMMQKMKLLSIPVDPMEKQGRKPNNFPQKYPNALAILLVNQLKKLERYNRERREVAIFYNKSFIAEKNFDLPKYQEDAIYLRYPLFFDNSSKIRLKAIENGILLGNWYHNVIDPKGVIFDAIGYKKRFCPRAQKAAQRVLNLPTKISMSEADYVVKVLKKLLT